MRHWHVRDPDFFCAVAEFLSFSAYLAAGQTASGWAESRYFSAFIVIFAANGVLALCRPRIASCALVLRKFEMALLNDH
jgi:hypothetical protein